MLSLPATLTLETYRQYVTETYNRLNSQQFESLYHYTSTGYRKINQSEQTNNRHSITIETIFNTDNTVALQQTYRGIKVPQKHNIGDTITFPTYTSTSVSPIEAYAFANKGEGTFYILKNVEGLAVSYDKKEMEILLNKNTQFTVENKIETKIFLQYPNTDYGITVECLTYILT